LTRTVRHENMPPGRDLLKAGLIAYDWADARR
jgi:hypothetical protein